jgi:argininosuccinate synthase
MLRANALYEGEYMLGTAIARPLIAKRQIEIAGEHLADAVAHGATGKGNDQVRFELAYYALHPDIRVIAPWREWDLTSRDKLLNYAEARGLEIAAKRGEAPPYSCDANLLHISYEGGELEDPSSSPSDDMWRRTRSPRNADAKGEEIEIEFKNGDPRALNNQEMAAADLLFRLNELGGRHGIGRADLVESRYVGMKSRGCYETPGGAILHKARRALEALTLDREVIRLKDDIMPRYAALVYNGYWFSPERKMLQAAIDDSQREMEGGVRLDLYRGNVTVRSRRAARSLYDADIATFDDDRGAYRQGDAEGFIKLNALRLRLDARRKGK